MGRKRHIYKTSLLKFVLNWLIQIFNGKLDIISTCCWDDLLLTWIILMRHVVQWLHHIIISPFLLSFFMFPLFFLLSLFSTFLSLLFSLLYMSESFFEKDYCKNGSIFHSATIHTFCKSNWGWFYLLRIILLS